MHYFGVIENGKMQLSNVGVIADLMWYEIKNHANNIELGEFVVMPNHVHGILILNDNKSHDNANVETLHATSNDTTSNHQTIDANVETLHATSLPNDNNKNQFMSSISPKSNTVSTIIRSYKSAVTKHCNRLGFEFGWQTRFYDHIIRDANSFETIQNYITNNPMNWGKDKFYGNE
jgi:REP element-mobilizing transposase RayT